MVLLEVWLPDLLFVNKWIALWNYSVLGFLLLCVCVCLRSGCACTTIMNHNVVNDSYLFMCMQVTVYTYEPMAYVVPGVKLPTLLTSQHTSVGMTITVSPLLNNVSIHNQKSLWWNPAWNSLGLDSMSVYKMIDGEECRIDSDMPFRIAVILTLFMKVKYWFRIERDSSLIRYWYHAWFDHADMLEKHCSPTTPFEHETPPIQYINFSTESVLDFCLCNIILRYVNTSLCL